MKLLRIKVNGLPLFQEELDINFCAAQRISDSHKDNLINLFANHYLNPVNSFIGINASGKTSTLKVIIFVLNLLNHIPIQYIEEKDILKEASQVKFNIFFYSKEEIGRLETVIGSQKNEIEGIKYSILSETLWLKDKKSVKSKKSLFDFSDQDIQLERSKLNPNNLLPDDMSIIISRKDSLVFSDFLYFTKLNRISRRLKSPFSKELLAFFDPSIEEIRFNENRRDIVLKFKNQESIHLNHISELNHYLSLGTIKGMLLFNEISTVLINGGLFIIDEIENHFNKEIVATIIRFFMA